MPALYSGHFTWYFVQDAYTQLHGPDLDRLEQEARIIHSLQSALFRQLPTELVKINERRAQALALAKDIELSALVPLNQRLESMESALDAADDHEERSARQREIADARKEINECSRQQSRAQREANAEMNDYVAQLVEITGLEEPKGEGMMLSKEPRKSLRERLIVWLTFNRPPPLKGTPEQNALAERLCQLAVLKLRLTAWLYIKMQYTDCGWVHWLELLQLNVRSLFDDPPPEGLP